MKSLIQRILQKTLGFKNYLWYFTLYKLRVLHRDQSEKDFFYFIGMLPKDAVVLDIGANLGLMSYYLSKESKQLHAFEPIPYNIEVLKRLKRKFAMDNMDIHEIALGDQNGSIELVLPLVDGVLKQGLSHVKHEKMEVFNEGPTYESPIYKLDDYSHLNLDVLHGIKIDVENFEYEAFKGAQETLKKFKPLIYCELWDNQNRYDCFELLQSIGYEIKVLEEDRLINYDRDNCHTQNFFFIHSDN